MGIERVHLVGTAAGGFVALEMKASGFVADALKRSNQPDASVAPPAMD